MQFVRFVFLIIFVMLGLGAAAQADERQGLWLRGDDIARVNVGPLRTSAVHDE